MFVAALLDALPEAEEAVRDAVAHGGVPDTVAMRLARRRTRGFDTAYLEVEYDTGEAPPSGNYAAITQRLSDSGLSVEVRDHALAIFRLLADAEAAVHGTAVDRVHFHEVADWDSIVDVVAAAALIDWIGPATWSCGQLPLGGGTIRTRHGPIPVPGPAATRILRGFAWHDDGVAGERVTPTGAAILRHVVDDPAALRPAGKLANQGMGSGTRDLGETANLLRVLVLEKPGAVDEAVAVIAFEIDDMTPEELATALDRLRTSDGVLDAGHLTGIGKKGRPTFAVRVIARHGTMARIIDQCFLETSTLGVRYGLESRRVLERHQHFSKGGKIGVKTALRPGGRVTAKVENEDIGEIPGFGRRRDKGREAEANVLADADHEE
jgi:uncharacterized protein (TIGR00299 family) protein